MATTRPSWSDCKVPILIFLAAFLFLALWAMVRQREPTFRPVPGGPMELRSHSQSTGDVAFTLKPGAFRSFKFAVPLDHENASFKGKFSAARSGNGIEAFVLNEEDYISWQNGYTTYRYYDSGDVQQGVLDVPLLADTAGTYYVIFDNDTRTATAINVKANMNLIYYTRWWPGGNN